MKFFTQLGRFFDRLDLALYIISGSLIVGLMFLVLVDVFLRNINRPLIGNIELVGVGLIYFTFLGSAWVLKKGGHVNMDLVINYAPARVKNMIGVAVYLLCTTLWLVMTWYSSRTLLDAVQNHFVWPGLLQIPKAFLLPAVPIGSFLLFVESLRKSIGHINSLAAKQPPAEEQKAPQVD